MQYLVVVLSAALSPSSGRLCVKSQDKPGATAETRCGTEATSGATSPSSLCWNFGKSPLASTDDEEAAAFLLGRSVVRLVAKHELRRFVVSKARLLFHPHPPILSVSKSFPRHCSGGQTDTNYFVFSMIMHW